MTSRISVVCLALFAFVALATGEEHDYYKTLRYPAKLVPGVGRDKVEQDGGPDAVGYKRRTVQWWPRKGHDIVDIPEGVPLRTWTRNKGQSDKEALGGLCRNWTPTDSETFKAHLIGFRGFGIETPDPRFGYKLTPAAVLRMENGERRAVLAYPPYHMMVSEKDRDFIHGIWRKEWKKIQATVSPEKYISNSYRRNPDSLVLETEHFTFVSPPKTPYKTLWWMRPHEPEKQDLYRKGTLEFAENMWAHIEASGSSMPYWRRSDPWKKYSVLIRLAIDGGYAGGGFNACDLRDATGGPRNLGLSHEWYHGHPGGGWSAGFFGETVCHGGRHFNIPGEVLMFSHNFCYPWRNVNCTQYQCPLWFFALGDNPNWGYGILSVSGCLASAVEPTAYHTIARLGQARGLWKNGVKGFGDFFGEYAARMATCDFVMQYAIRSKYGMPEMSFLLPVYGREGRYRIPNSEAPRMYGFNVVRLVRAGGASTISVGFQGLDEAKAHGDWRACIVAVDGEGRARYSPLWNKGKMDFALRAEDKHLWLTVAATPSALPVSKNCDALLAGTHAPRYPWEVTLAGCLPGSPHRKQGDVVNLDELYALNNGNKYMGYPVKNEVPIPLTAKDGKLAQQKLADILRRTLAADAAQKAKIDSGQYNANDWWERGKPRIVKELTRRVAFLQRSAKGHRHPNGGGFVSDSARVARTAYVGPNAMVLDGARVEDSAIIHEYAVVHGPKTLIRGHAKIGGKAWVFGDITVGGNARIMESANVTTAGIGGTRGSFPEGQGEISGNVVLKGEHVLRLCDAKGQVLTGELVMDYTPGYSGTVGYYELVPGIMNFKSGVFKHGRICGRGGLDGGVDAGSLYVNWQFNQPKTVTLEDSYVNNNGILHGRPTFAADGEHKYVAFNGKDQYAEAPASVADFGELTIDMLVNSSGGKSGRVFDFGTGEGECVYLTIEGGGGKLRLVARHGGKSYSLAASQGIGVNTWARLRVEMDGSTARMCIDGKQVARGKFTFRPRDVFIGDRTEGNFIACGRNKSEFFKGKMDHFRIYRTVHDDFNAIGPVPSALTQVQEWSEEDQQRSDLWAGRRGAKEAEIKAGKYGRLQDEIKQLERQKADVYKTAKRAELEGRARDAENRKRSLDRKGSELFRALAASIQAEKEIKALREKIDAITREIRLDKTYVKLTEDIRTCEKRRGEMERDARESPEFKAMLAKVAAAEGEKRKAEERVRQLPELVKLKAMSEQEKDNQKKRELRDKYNRLFAVRRTADSDWQKADIAQQRLRKAYNDAVRNAIDSHAGRREMEEQIRKLRTDQSTLETKLRESHSQLATLEKSLRTKDAALRARRREAEADGRATDAYKKAAADLAAAREALKDEQSRVTREKAQEFASIALRIEKLRKESQSVWDSALKIAGLFGPNPYPGREAAALKNFQDSLIYHTTADWDDKTREEAAGTVTPRMKTWIKKVRGY